MRTMDQTQMRRLVLVVGLVVLAAIAAMLYGRGVDRVEVIGTLLFIPIFVGLVFGRIVGGVIVALLAAAAYAALRAPAIEVVGAEPYMGLLISRTVAYLAFGAVGGWATRALEASLNKLDLYDQIDDETGLYNARFLVQDIDLEVARSKRYSTIFSLSLVTIPDSALKKVGRRKRRRVIRDLGEVLKKSVRSMDRVAHVQSDEGHHRFALVLPETEKGGNEILTGRLANGVAQRLRASKIDVSPEDIYSQAITYPDDPEELQRARARFAELARQRFPEGSVPSDDPAAPTGRDATS